MIGKQYPRMVPNPSFDPKTPRSEAEIRVENPAEHEARSPLDYALFTTEAPAVNVDEVSRAVNNAVFQERLRCANIAAKWPGAKAVAAEIASAIRKAPEKVAAKAVAKASEIKPPSKEEVLAAGYTPEAAVKIAQDEAAKAAAGEPPYDAKELALSGGD